MPKKEETSKVILERIYNIPLRRQTLKVPPFKKANKAVKTVREFISKHMKSDDVIIGEYLNLKIWDHGAKNPPHHVKVNVTKDDKGKVVVELFGAPKVQPKVEEKKKAESKEEKVVKEAEFKEIQEEKAEKAKIIEQEEIKELKKEHPPKHTPKIPAKTRLQEVRPPAPRSV